MSIQALVGCMMLGIFVWVFVFFLTLALLHGGYDVEDDDEFVPDDRKSA